MVRVVGLEPTRPCGHQILSLARLPIPPHPHRYDINIERHDVLSRNTHKIQVFNHII